MVLSNFDFSKSSPGDQCVWKDFPVSFNLPQVFNSKFALMLIKVYFCHLYSLCKPVVYSWFVPHRSYLPAPPAGSHSPVLSGNIFPQTLALCSLLTASVPNQAGTMSCREREKERWKNGPEREREWETPRNNKKPGLPLLIRRLKRTAPKAGAHVSCCHGTRLGDGSLLPKMAALLCWAVQWRLICVELLPSWVCSCQLHLYAGAYVRRHSPNRFS